MRNVIAAFAIAALAAAPCAWDSDPAEPGLLALLSGASSLTSREPSPVLEAALPVDAPDIEPAGAF
ncbi:hypothetical protein [Ensifer sp.]|jgi:hypothetical protein|uniref:hypothetical protein n=1 Tax=Ensifer sp. TaxID=1872086 RepID=UPI002E14201E|nr:hypothetical protein [Ensifer sp.]